MEKLITPYTIKIYECDRHKQLRLLCLFNMLQDVADMHADKLGVGYDFCLQHGIGWVGANYHLKIGRLPHWQEKITLETWASGKTAVSGIRDFEAFGENGDSLFHASSQWALINLESLRPVAVAKNLPEYEIRPVRKIDTSFPPIPLPERTDFEYPLAVRYDDIDVNNHVNNAVYPLWASESVPHDFREDKDIAEMEIAFKKPALFDDAVAVFTQIDGDVTTHRIASADQAKDFARVRITWRKR